MGDDANGVKLPYFHRHQSQEDKDLIGDITPKIINDVKKNTYNRGALSSSSWNAAETWEERDNSQWSFLQITELFNSDFEISSEGCIAKLSILGKDSHRSNPLIDPVSFIRYRDEHFFLSTKRTIFERHVVYLQLFCTINLQTS